jgi:hypothetical protein
MKAKEKADELVKKMYKAHSNSASLITLYFAKQCALIAVDEILDSRPVITDSQVEYQLYWREVKNEIELIGDDKGV